MLLLVPLHQLLLPLILGMAGALVHKRPPLRDRRCLSPPVLEIPKLDKWLKPWRPVQATNWHPAALFIKCTMLQHRTTLRSFKNLMRMLMWVKTKMLMTTLPYLGTSQLGELQAGTDTAPVLKSKKKKSTKPKTEDKAEEATLREKRKADHGNGSLYFICRGFPSHPGPMSMLEPSQGR